MNIELSKNAVIAIIVAALLIVGFAFMKLAKPSAPPIPEGYDPRASSPGGPP